MLLEIYIVFCSVSILLLFLIRLFSGSKRKRSRPLEEGISVIIPFRNEDRNLKGLLKDLSTQKVTPDLILFVDDHSSDNSAAKVLEFCEEHSFAQYLALPKGDQGKKKAIDKAMRSVSTPIVMTLDADVRLSQNFFASVEDLSSSSMCVRPVILTSRRFMQHFYALEQLLLSSFNYLLFPVYPITASGANLIYRKDDYLKYNDLASHGNISSGDDHFLLKNFLKNDRSVEISNQKQHAVYSEAPKGFGDYISQRVRWLSKTMIDKNPGDTLIGIYFLLYLIGGFALSLHLLFQGNFEGLLLIMLVRIVLDGAVLLTYDLPLKENRKVLLLPANQIIQPILMIVVMISSLFYKPKWKGRKI